MSHSDAVLLIGPLPPLLPRALCVRLKVAAVVGAAAVFTVVLLATVVLVLRSGMVRDSGLDALDALLPNFIAGRIPAARGDTVAVSWTVVRSARRSCSTTTNSV